MEPPAWWHVAGIAKKMKLTHLRAINIRIGEFRQSATDAYLVEPHKAGGTWLISSQVWTTKS